MKKELVLALGLFMVTSGILFGKEARVQPYAFSLATSGGGATISVSPAMYFSLVATATGIGGAVYDESCELSNTSIGCQALWNINGGNWNTACGTLALNNTITGNYNTATGYYALYSNVSGGFNTATGAKALSYNTGGGNTANGCQALESNTFGKENTAVGAAALLHNTIGSNNTAVGSDAGSNCTGSYNIHIGSLVYGNPDDSNTIRIGFRYVPEWTPPGGQCRTFIAGIVETPLTKSDGPSVVGITGQGQLGLFPAELLPEKGDPGDQGPPGPQGEGLVSGSLLFLPPNIVPPAGYNLLGSTTYLMRRPNGRTTLLNVNIYQKL